MVLAKLLPLLCQLVNWFEGLVIERRGMSEVRSSELETRLSSSDNPMGVEVDTAISNPREVRVFSILGEEYGLDIKTLSRFSQRFQFPERVRVRLPCAEE